MILFFAAHLGAQETYMGIVPGSAKFHPFISIGGGPCFSVINNRKEVKGNYKPGDHFFIGIHTKPWFYWSFEYSGFVNHASGSINDIKAWNSELDGNFLFDIGQTKYLFKFLFGAGHLDWRGTYIGPSLNDNNKYYIGMRLMEKWYCGNLGCGVARTLGRGFMISADYRMRFASEKKDLLSISDTGFYFDVAWNIHGKKFYGENQHDMDKKQNKGKPGRIYKWMKNRRSQN
ncbi:MAG: hypothetical protein HY064_04385 [Bacteroidetes bacterium]|nr:hypothetical protein [Bacteroidota bacterium]